MRKLVLSWLLLLVSPIGLASGPDAAIELIFAGIHFKIPAQQEVIALGRGKQRFLIFKYGKRKGKEYLSFTDRSDDIHGLYGCEASKFYARVFGTRETGECKARDVAIYRAPMLSEKKKNGVWRGTNMTAYFSIGGRQSCIFVFQGSDKFIQIDSDFLDKEALKGILVEYVQ